MTSKNIPRAKPLKWKYLESNGWKKGKAVGLCGQFLEAIVYRSENGWLFGGILYRTEKSAKAAAEKYHQAKWLSMME